VVLKSKRKKGNSPEYCYEEFHKLAGLEKMINSASALVLALLLEEEEQWFVLGNWV
jgi:hypothetical protein